MGKMQRKGWEREQGRGQRGLGNECQIVVLNVMLFDFLKLTLSLIKP